MIKVRTGQVWASNHSKNEFTLNVGANGLIHGKSKLGGIYNWDKSDFHRNFKFIPQNDLERMAIDTPEWHWGDHCFYRHGGMVTKENHTKIFKSEWQNMRYHLGQDKKPHYRLTGGEWVKQC